MELFELFGTIGVRYSDAVDAIDRVTRSADGASDSLDGMGDAAEDAEDPIEDSGDAAKDADGKFSAWQVTLGNLAANAMQKVIDKCVDIAKSVIELGMDFTATMSEVEAISGASAEDMELLEQTAREFGSTTKFSAVEAAEALKYMSMAGWDAGQSAAALGGVLDLAAASGEELGTTSDIVTDAMTAFGMSAGEAGHFADVLAVASSSANTNVSLLGESFKYCAPVAGSMGASVEDTAIALGLMANAGIKGSAAGNSLKNALVNLVKPTEQQANAMAELGLLETEWVNVVDEDKVAKARSKVESKTIDLQKAQIAYNDAVAKYGAQSSQAQTKMLNLQKAENALADVQDELTKAQEGTFQSIRTGGSAFTDEEGNMKSLGEIMDVLREKLGGLDIDIVDAEGNLREYDDIMSDLTQTEEGLAQAEQMQSAAILFGKQNLSGMLAVINASEEDYRKLTDAIYSSENAASDMAATMNDNLKGDLASMNSAFEELKLKIFDGAESPLRGLVQLVTNKVVPMLTYLIEHFDKVAPVLAGLTTAIITFKAAMAITGIIQAAVTAFQAYQAANEGATVAQWLLNAAMSANPIVLIVSLIAGLIAAIAVLWATNEDFRNGVTAVWETVKNAIGTAIDAVVSFFQKAWSFLEGYGEYLYDWISGIVSAVSNFFDAVWNVIQTGFLFIVELVKGYIQLVTLPWRFIWENCKDYLIAAWEAIKSAVSTAINAVKTTIETVWNAVKTFFSTIWEAYVSIVTAYLNAIWNVITTVFNAVRDFITTVFNAVRDFFSGIWEAISGKVTTVIIGIRDKVQSIFESVRSTISDKLTAAKNTVTSIFDNIKTSVQTKIEAARDFVKNAIEKIKGFFNFSWSLPKLKLPHFKISGSFSLDPPSVPSFGIDWYAKGGIMERPTVFGFNPATGRAQVGGEAGAEAIAPIDTLLGFVRTAVQEENAALGERIDRVVILLEEYLPALLRKTFEVILDSGTLVGELAPALNDELGYISDDDQRRRG